MQTFMFAYIKPLDSVKVENVIEVLLKNNRYTIHYLDEQGERQIREVPQSHFMDTQISQFSIPVIKPDQL